MSSHTISETCCCGAKFNYTQISHDKYDHRIEYEHTKFLEAHKDCRAPAVIADGKQLKAFLTNKFVSNYE